MRSFTHLNARTTEEACALLEAYAGHAVLNAGGTDLLGTLRAEYLHHYPAAVINIKSISGLDGISETDGVLMIGALARLSDIATSTLLKERYRCLAEAAHAVASPHIRNAATIGGNLCQDIRCWYYRYPRSLGGPLDCLRKGSGSCLAVKGDNRYHAIMGGKSCFAVCPSDIAVALAALDALVIVTGPTGTRRIPVTDFFGPLATALGRSEMVAAIEVPRVESPMKQAFLKFTLRKPVDFAIVSVASVITIEDGVCRDVRIALGGVAPGPVRARGAEETLKGGAVSQATAIEASDRAVEGARPLRNNGYKIAIVRALIKRAVLADP